MDDFAGERIGELDMRLTRPWMIAGLILIAPTGATSGAQAQLLPGGGGLGAVGQVVPDTLGRVGAMVDAAGIDRLAPERLTERLATARLNRITDLLRNHGDRIELDDRREPARRGVILLTGADEGALKALRAAGYGVEGETVEGIDLPIVRLTPPGNRTLSRALRDVRKLAPRAQASADNLYFPSGPALAMASGALAGGGRVEGRVAGLIDGGVARHPALNGPIEQRGFAQGAPRASAHGTAVASLISGDGVVRGAAPGAPLLVADVYGDDPAGGGTFAIVRALGWMAARGVRVVTVSLVGPANPLLDGAIRLARDKGVTVVAAVGNDGPAAPPAYPASYPSVIAVTGIDGRGRTLPEAGRALHVDFAAPGADMQAADSAGGKSAVRGTSFAAPLVAGRLFARGTLAALKAEADPARRGQPPLLCANCRNNE
ncbi:S8 family serine peptidase [Sphingobium sp. CR2-8]|uniref:S8 family serine peptidase n=1 Tax=Sphingobium sp. CR2-8 TaxID=1306534 RepID=UPI002DB677F5|nr:S8 family serine peptidase [Sphingobium sp. CR2-8]MEC3910817.1 S8 family serine peptidase [Sphingobium sp. CR2-8]